MCIYIYIHIHVFCMHSGLKAYILGEICPDLADTKRPSLKVPVFGSLAIKTNTMCTQRH